MAQVGPMLITAHNREQAEYVIRSRAQQRGVPVDGVEVAEAGAGNWLVTVLCADDDAPKLSAASLDQDTQRLYLKDRPPTVG